MILQGPLAWSETVGDRGEVTGLNLELLKVPQQNLHLIVHLSCLFGDLLGFLSHLYK